MCHKNSKYVEYEAEAKELAILILPLNKNDHDLPKPELALNNSLKAILTKPTVT